MSFIIDPETLNASPREWTVHGLHDAAGPIFVVHINVDDFRAAHPDLAQEEPAGALAARRPSWESACEKAIAEKRPMPIYDEETTEKDARLNHMRIVLQPHEF